MKIRVKGLTVYSAGFRPMQQSGVGIGGGGCRNPVRGPYSKGSAGQGLSGQRVRSQGATEQLWGSYADPVGVTGSSGA